jgi:hypothetical protein
MERKITCKTDLGINKMEYQDLRLYEPGLDLVCPTTPKLNELIARHAIGKNKQNVEGEILLAFRTALRREGRFAVSTVRLNSIYNSRVRDSIMSAVNELSDIVENYICDKRCYQRQLKSDFFPNAMFKNVQQYMVPFVSLDVCDSYVCDSIDISSVTDWFVSIYHSQYYVIENLKDVTFVTLDEQWYRQRQKRWTDLALMKPSWDLNYCQGYSKVGRAVLESLAQVSIPTTIDLSSLTDEKLKHALRYHQNLLQNGIPRAITRSSGRLYHWLLFGNKLLRRAILLGGEPTVEIDMHATFHCLLVAKMTPSPERNRLIEILQEGKFYDPFFADYHQFYHGPKDSYRSHVKKQVQRQLLFTKDFRCEERQLMLTCEKEYPEYAKYLTSIQKKAPNASRRAKSLMKREAEIWIDRILVEAFGDGSRPVIPYHDSIQCRRSDAEQVMEIAKQIVKDELGFLPKLKTQDHFKSTDSICESAVKTASDGCPSNHAA